MVTRPPLNFASAAPHIDNNVLGITSGESLGGVDNITSIGVGNTTLGTYERIGGNTYHTSAPTVTIVAPTTRTIATAKVSTSDNTITVDAWSQYENWYEVDLHFWWYKYASRWF